MNDVYINHLLESEEMQFYIKNFSGKGIKKNPTQEKYRNMPKEELLNLYGLVNLKKSHLSKKERDYVIYFAEKELNK